jgi:mycofactocin biosynthetic radical S-adenosylmethionine protein MftC
MQYSVGWGFGKCNMRCKHCYSESGPVCPQYDLSLLKMIADKICPDISAVNYGTGEFGFNLNTFQLLQYIHEQYPQVYQAVTSNGSTGFLLTRAQLMMFNDLDFSVDFPDPDRHNEFRQHPKAWDMVMKELAICHKEGMDISIVTCVTGVHTDDDIKELLELAHRFDASWRVNWFRPTGRGKRFNQQFGLSPRRAWDILKLVSNNAQIESLSDPLFDAICNTHYSQDSGCACGEKSCRIQTNLTVTPCVFLGGKRWSGGSIVDRTLPEIFASDTFQAFRARRPKLCLSCQFWETCRGGCASRAVLYRGKLNEPDGFCPIVNNIGLDELSDIHPIIKPHTHRKVHDGYLCTLICKV